MNPNLPSSPIVSGTLPLPAADPAAAPATVVPNLAPPGADFNPPPVFNQAPMPQAPLAPPAALSPPIPPAAPPPVPPPPVPPQAINAQVLPAAPVQMVAPPQAASMPMPSAAVPPNTMGNMAVAPAMGGMLTPQPAQVNVAPAPKEMLDRKVFTKPFVVILIVLSVLVLIAGLFFWSYIRTP